MEKGLVTVAVKLGALAFQVPQPVNRVLKWRELAFVFGQPGHVALEFLVVQAPDFVV